jgi:hypothetical protein
MTRSQLANLFSFFILISTVNAGEAPKNLKEGGTWVSDESPKVKVKLDPAKPSLKQQSATQGQGVHVFLNKSEGKNPASIGMTFVDAAGKKTYVELKAADPMKFPTRYEGASSATADSRSQSYIGFELKIPFGSTKSTVLKSEDLHKETE